MSETTNENDMNVDRRYIKVMADYMSSCLWHADGIQADIDELPVSAALRTRIAQWADWYNVNDDFLPAAERKNRLDLRKFNDEGLAIARAVKRELPDWTVVWWDECELIAQVESGAGKSSRELYEFEIMGDGSLGPARAGLVRE